MLDSLDEAVTHSQSLLSCGDQSAIRQPHPCSARRSHGELAADQRSGWRRPWGESARSLVDRGESSSNFCGEALT